MMFNPPSPTVRPSSDPNVHGFTVETQFIDGLGRLATRSQIIYAPTTSSVKRMLYATMGSKIRSIRIIPLSVKK
jgi:hypothetical protein